MQLFVLISLLMFQNTSGIMKSTEIKPGMKGYGLTVFKGEKIEKFKIEVISVIPNTLLKQSLILVKCSHPIINHAGIIAGMSGSPIYINGKFAGGLGYGFIFSKDPLALITPAENIVKSIKKPIYNFDTWGRNPLKNLSVRNFNPNNYFKKTKFVASLMPKSSSIVPLSVPLSVSGISSLEFKKFFPDLSKLGPIVSGGSVSSSSSSSIIPKISKPFAPGSPVAISLVSGDINIGGIGTVTHIIGNKMAIFSHPFLSLGESRVPVSHAWIHTVVASIYSSRKMGTITNSEGVVVGDGQAAVIVDKSTNPGFVPLKIQIFNPKLKPQEFNFKIIRHRFFTARWINNLLRYVLIKTSQNLTDMTYSIQFEINSTDLPPIKFTDYFSSTRGIFLGFGSFVVSSSSYNKTIYLDRNSSRGQIALNMLLNNPFKRTAIKSVNIKVYVSHGLNSYSISKVETLTNNVSANSELPIKVYLKPVVGEEITKIIKIKIPESLAGYGANLLVSSGPNTFVDSAFPKNLSQLYKYITSTFDAHSLVVSMNIPSPSIEMNGVLIRNLPLSVLDSITKRNTTQIKRARQVIYRKVIRIPEIIYGNQIIKIKVQERNNIAK